MAAVKHVSFDLDGTLINSLANMKTAWTEATEELQIKCGFSEYRRYIGLPFPKILEMLGLGSFLDELSDAYFSRTRALAGQISEIDGAQEIVDLCRAKGLKTSIITSKPRKNSEDIISTMGFDVDALACGDDHAKGKPDPALAYVVCNELGVAPAETLYVGDMVFDLQFALNAGMAFLLFKSPGAVGLPSNLLNRCEEVASLRDIAQKIG